MINSADLVAKLLANENLMVTRTNSRTAYFDVKNRVLNLPLWKNMTDNIEGMMIAHEVGHALYTSTDKWQTVNEDRLLRGYVNVIEDARIEKLVKRKYPGTRKTFSAGYRELIEKDFFELKDRDLNTLLPIDKINMYFKAGISCGVRFNAEEKVFVERAERTETMDEVIQLSKDILEYSRNFFKDLETKNQDIMQQMRDELAQEADDEEDSFDDEYQDEYSDDEQPEENEDEDASEEETELDTNLTKPGETSEEDELESKTDSSLKRKLEELADDSIEYRYYELVEKDSHDVYVPFKQVIAETKEIDRFLSEDPSIKDNFEKFMHDSERVVSYLVKEFEMRKSATAYKRAQISKSGGLNLNKLYAHKLSDDIFRRIMSIPNGKNHGMIFLLDWSGSMSDVIIPTVKQVINLAMFCRRIQIPFEVYAFSGNHYLRRNDTEFKKKIDAYNKELLDDESKVQLWSDDELSLLNLFSSKMTNTEFNTVARRFTTPYFHYSLGYSLGDTPLNEALLKMASFIPKYKKQNSIEKLTFITLTDGQGNNLRTGKYISGYGHNDRGQHIKIKNFIRDVKNNKDYPITNDACSTTEQLLRMLKDRYDITTLGFYIVQNKIRNLYRVFNDNLGKHPSSNDIWEMRKHFKEHGFYSLKGTGRDDMFVIPDTSTKIVDQELEIDSKASAAAIARKFGKMFNTKKQSRVLLDRFISLVA